MVSSLGFVRWCGMAALVAALAYIGLLLLQFLPFYLAFLQPYEPDPSLGRWTAVVLMPGILAALVGLFPLLRERHVPIVFVPLGIALGGVALLLWGAIADALYGVRPIRPGAASS